MRIHQCWLADRRAGSRPPFAETTPIIIGVSHQIGHYADALRGPAGYEQIIPREHRG